MKKMIEDLLSTVQFKTAIYFKYGFCSPWGMKVAPGPHAQFHLVAQGNCLLKIGKELIVLEKGDIAVFPRGDSHQIMDHPKSKCRSGKAVVVDIMEGRAPFAGENIKTQLVCGHYEIDQEVSHPIFTDLPAYLIIKSQEYGRFDLLYTLFDLIIEEMDRKYPGHELISLRLAEVLFISVMRHYYQRVSKAENLFKDEAIFRSVNWIHQQINTPLNIATLSRQAGLSRTLFVERFKKAVGSPPLQYIKSWRMIKAKKLLQESQLSLSEIGEQIGYASENSFHRVFKQSFQISPGKFRKSLAAKNKMG